MTDPCTSQKETLQRKVEIASRLGWRQLQRGVSGWMHGLHGCFARGTHQATCLCQYSLSFRLSTVSCNLPLLPSKWCGPSTSTASLCSLWATTSHLISAAQSGKARYDRSAPHHDRMPRQSQTHAPVLCPHIANVCLHAKKRTAGELGPGIVLRNDTVLLRQYLHTRTACVPASDEAMMCPPVRVCMNFCSLCSVS